MKKIRSLCLLGLANLECPAEACDIEKLDKKSGKANVMNVCEMNTHDQEDLLWFQDYRREHQSFDGSLDQVGLNKFTYR